jgi:hypothetical protein
MGHNAVAGFHLFEDSARGRIARLFFQITIMIGLFSGTRQSLLMTFAGTPADLSTPEIEFGYCQGHRRFK